MKLIIITLLILSVSCSKSSSSGKRETPINEEQIQHVMANQNFECAAVDGSCPAGVARLLIINPLDPNLSAVCSGFMMSPNRLVTNHHCVSTQEFCNGTYIAVYSKTGYTSTKCKLIVETEQDVADPNDPSRAIDYTIMETVDIYDGGFFPLSNNLADAGDLIRAWVIDHTGLDKMPPNLFDARVTELDCRVIDQSSKESLVMKNCAIISGNSGSVALNREGEVIGVIWGGTATSEINSSLDLTLRRQLNELGLATEVNYLRD